jgi:ubiquinone/menaquinone biosynthesis C-methylase UbiE
MTIKQKIKKIFGIKSGYDNNAGRYNAQYRAKWIIKKLNEIPAGKSILDAGAGEMPFKKNCIHLNYTSQDFGKYSGNKDNLGIHESENWNTDNINIKSDIINIPVPDNTFDAILCSEVFEHIPEPIEAIKEFSRILRDKGVLILTAPTISLTHQEPFYFYSGFSKYFYQKHLSENGFRIVEIKENGNYFEFIAQELRRVHKVANEYANERRKGHEIKATGTVLKMLDRFSKAGENSKHLTSYGYHVLAIKNNEK